MFRKLIGSVGLALSAALAVGALNSVATTAGFEPAAPPVVDANSHVGTFVSASETEFTMKDEAGKLHRHTLANDAKVTDPNGKPCKITDLTAEQKIRVTTSADDKNKATKVECVV